jgi:hypothetical protein
VLNSCTAKFYKDLTLQRTPGKKKEKKRITTKTTTGSQFSTTRRRRRRRRNLEGTEFSERRKGKERSPLLT